MFYKIESWNPASNVSLTPESSLRKKKSKKKKPPTPANIITVGISLHSFVMTVPKIVFC